MFVGSHEMKVKDDDKDISFPVLVMYPTAFAFVWGKLSQITSGR